MNIWLNTQEVSSEKECVMYPVPLLWLQISSLSAELLRAQKPFLIFYTNAQERRLHTVNLHFYGDEPILYARELSMDFAEDTFFFF